MNNELKTRNNCMIVSSFLKFKCTYCMNSFRIIVVFLVSTFCYSQNDINKGVVFYSQIESPFLGGRNGSEILSCLVFNKAESSYVTRKDSLASLIITASKSLYENKDENSIVINNGEATYKNGFQVYTSLKKDSVWSSSRWKEFAYVKEKKAHIDWKLSNESKKIGTFECQKATATFRGREYTAWYTNEIPLPYGPWKLQGLPGLILEAYDKDGAFYFGMKKIEYPSQNSTPISKVIIEKDKKWLSVKEYLDWCDQNLQAAYEKGILLGVKAIKGTREKTYKEISE